MDKIIIEGQNPLSGTVSISGAKSECTLAQTKKELPVTEFVQPNVQTFFAAASAAGACALPNLLISTWVHEK